MWKNIQWRNVIQNIPRTLLQIFCEVILNFKVIVKSILDPEDNFLEELLSIRGINHTGLIHIMMPEEILRDKEGESLSQNQPELTLMLVVANLANTK